MWGVGEQRGVKPNLYGQMEALRGISGASWWGRVGQGLGAALRPPNHSSEVPQCTPMWGRRLFPRTTPLRPHRAAELGTPYTLI